MKTKHKKINAWNQMLLDMNKLIKKNIKLLNKALKLYDGCYIAVIKTMENTYDLEVEVDSGTIAFIYPTGIKNITKAREMANALQACIEEKLGSYSVYETREEWEEKL